MSVCYAFNICIYDYRCCIQSSLVRQVTGMSGSIYCLNLSAAFIVQVPIFRNVLEQVSCCRLAGFSFSVWIAAEVTFENLRFCAKRHEGTKCCLGSRMVIIVLVSCLCNKKKTLMGRTETLQHWWTFFVWVMYSCSEPESHTVNVTVQGPAVLWHLVWQWNWCSLGIVGMDRESCWTF